MRHRLELLAIALTKAHSSAGKPEECRKFIEAAQLIVNQELDSPVIVQHGKIDYAALVDAMT